MTTETESVTASDVSVDVSVIVPAWNEGENIPLLVPRIAAALALFSCEILIVDDGSKDATPSACAELARLFPVRLIVRENPKHGLSGAVLHGIAESRGRTVAVMDADLQHPPERITALLEALDHGADFALGSRYIDGGSTDGQWTFFRKVNSWVATLLARPFAGPVKDPMSGFFALRRATFDRAERLTPLGYKIALELICKCRVNRVREVPIHFGLRTRGESKLNLRQQFRYLEHLSRLYDFTFPRASPILKFAITLIVGFLLGIALFAVALALGFRMVPAVMIGYLGTIVITTVFHLRYVRTQRPFLMTRRPWGDFIVISATECVVAANSALWLVRHSVIAPPEELFIIAFGCAVVVRYILRKEMLHDIRGLRRDPRVDDLAD